MPSADLTKSSVHIQVPLTNYAQGYGFPDMVAERVLPVIPVQKETDKYYKFNKEELQDQNTLRADGDPASEMTWDVTSAAYIAEEYAMRKLVTDRVMRNADAVIKPKMTSVKKLKRVLMIAQERRVQALVQSTTHITNNGGVGTKWDAASGMNIRKDVDTAKDSLRRTAGVMANAMLIDYASAQAVMRYLMTTAYTTFAEWLDKNELPPVLWGLETIVGGAVRNTANAAATESLADIWTDNVLIFHKDPDPDPESPGLGYIFRAQDFQVIEYRVDERKGVMEEVSVIEDEVITHAAAGYLITDVLT